MSQQLSLGSFCHAAQCMNIFLNGIFRMWKRDLTLRVRICCEKQEDAYNKIIFDAVASTSHEEKKLWNQATSFSSDTCLDEHSFTQIKIFHERGGWNRTVQGREKTCIAILYLCSPGTTCELVYNGGCKKVMLR